MMFFANMRRAIYFYPASTFSLAFARQLPLGGSLTKDYTAHRQIPIYRLLPLGKTKEKAVLGSGPKTAAGAIERASAGMNNYLYTLAIKVFARVWGSGGRLERVSPSGDMFAQTHPIVAPPQAVFQTATPTKRVSILPPDKSQVVVFIAHQKECRLG